MRSKARGCDKVDVLEANKKKTWRKITRRERQGSEQMHLNIDTNIKLDINIKLDMNFLSPARSKVLAA